MLNPLWEVQTKSTSTHLAQRFWGSKKKKKEHSKAKKLGQVLSLILGFYDIKPCLPPGIAISNDMTSHEKGYK